MTFSSLGEMEEALIEAGFAVAGAASSMEEALQLADETKGRGWFSWTFV